MSQMEETAAREFNAVTESAGRERLSEANMFNLTVQDYEQCRQQVDESTVVTFLSSPSGSAGHSTSEVADVAAKRPRVSSPLPDSSSVYPGQHPCTTGTQVPITEGSDSEGEHFSIQPPFPSFDGSDNGLNTDTESSRQVGSTLAEALLPPPITRLQQEESEYLDISAPDRLPIEDRIPPLGGRSRALIKEYFAGNEISNLPKGHPAIVFSEDQINSVVRVIAAETSRASYDMLENLIQKASQLSLGPRLPSGKSPKKTDRRGSYARSLSGARYQDSSSGECKDTSGALRTDEDLGSLG